MSLDKIVHAISNNQNLDNLISTLSTVGHMSIPDQGGGGKETQGWWNQAIQTVNWWVNSAAYTANQTRINNERTLEYNALRDSKQFTLQAMGQCLQYIQHEKGIKVQEQQGELNRQVQEKLAGLQRELQRQEGILNRELQRELSELQREFQANEGRLNRDHALQLENFRQKLQIYLFESQKQLQLEIQELNANLARELKLMDRENSLAIIQEQRRAQNFPLTIIEEHILACLDLEQIPFNIFFVPPVIKYDPKGSSPDTKDFPVIEMDLRQSLATFLNQFKQSDRSNDYYDGAWQSKSFGGTAAYTNVFQGLKAVPTGIIDCLIEGDKLKIVSAHWSDRFRLPISEVRSVLNWKEILFTFAKKRLLQWYAEREKFKLDHGNTKQFDELYGPDCDTFSADLEVLKRELQFLAQGKNPRDHMSVTSRNYHIMSSDIDQFRLLLAQEIHLIAGLMIDEYYLLGVAPKYRRDPLLPRLFPSLVQNCPADILESRINKMVTAYASMYQGLEEFESALIPELRLALVESLINISREKLAKEQLCCSLKGWLKLEGVNTSTDDLASLLSMVSDYLTTKDIEYVKKLNRCLIALKENCLSIETSCYNRGLRRLQSGEAALAVTDFNQTIDLNPHALAYHQRGRAYYLLEKYSVAIADFDSAVQLKPNLSQAYKDRGDAYYGLNQYELAIANYNQAIECGHNSAQEAKNRVQREWEALKSQQAQAERQRRLEEEARRKAAEQEARRKAEEEEAQRKAAEQEARRKAQEEAKRKALRTIDLGNGITLELVEIPAGNLVKHWDNNQSIKINTFLLAKHPITNEQWYAIMGTNPSAKYGYLFARPKKPVVGVSWNDAQAFCLTLRERINREVRLPSEAEWEYASRGGTTNTKYHFGNDDNQLDQYAWYDGNSGGQTHEVMLKKPNQYGLYDMMGNVWEWCKYNNDSSNRVVRGGSWGFSSNECVVSSRVPGYLPGDRHLGFSVVLGA